MAIEIPEDLTIKVRIPKRVSDREALKFVKEKEEWIDSAIARVKERKKNRPEKVHLSETELKIIKKKAKRDIPILVDEYAPKIGVTYQRISIRYQKTVWGSCTPEGNLNFNCALVCLPERVMRYVVVHELCHRKEMNHSPRFWKEVEKILPDYKELRKWLKENGNRWLE